MIQVFRSKRIYKKDLDNKTVEELSLLTKQYNQILHSAYNQIVLEKRHKNITQDDSLYFKMKRLYPDVNVYLLNSAMQSAKAIYKSQSELKKLDKDILREKIQKINKKLEKVTEQKEEYQIIKDNLKKGEKPFKVKTTKYKVHQDGKVSVTAGTKKRRKTIWYNNIYDFEYQYLKEKQKELKSRLGHLTFKLNKLKTKYDKLNNNDYIKSIVFGSKKLFKQSLCNNKKKVEFRNRRNYRFEVSGRCDSIDGNFVFRYDCQHNL